jgi:hypothetical protein
MLAISFFALSLISEPSARGNAAWRQTAKSGPQLSGNVFAVDPATASARAELEQLQKQNGLRSAL